MNIIPETLLATSLTGNVTVEQWSFVKLGVIIVAIQNGQLLHFTYDGKLRIVEAHAIGKSTKDGSLIMRGYQVGGEASRPLPQWTLFSLDKIETGTLRLGSGVNESLAPREGYKMGDKQMSPVLAEIDTTG